MVQTYRNLWSQIANFEALHTAYLAARRGKRYTTQVLRFSSDLEVQLLMLLDELQSGAYKVGPYRTFWVTDPKAREVAALPFRDRVVQHALVSAIEPIWEARFIHDSYACRVGRGTHAGANRLTAFLRRGHRMWSQTYVLKGDIKSYFASIDHVALRGLLSRRIACTETLHLINDIIDSWRPVDGVGIPIGNLSSQLFANVYLHELDKYVKQVLHEQFYLRYMDDFVILGEDKSHLNVVRLRIKEFLQDRLSLVLNRKTAIFPADCGIDFLGYKIWRTHRLLRKRSIIRMRKKIARFHAGHITREEMRASIASWIGHCGHADTHTLRSAILGGIQWQ